MSSLRNIIPILIHRNHRLLMKNLNLFQKHMKFSPINNYGNSMIAQESCNQTKKANFKATKSVPIIMDLNTVTQDALKVITKVQGPNMITLNSITRIPIDLKVAKSKTTIKLITAFRERTEVVTNMVEMVRAERHVVG